MHKKKHTLLFMALMFFAMAFAMTTVPSSAASKGYQASIGKKKYKTLRKAIKKAKDGQTITLNKNITYKKVLNFSKSGKKIKLNLNGHTITFRKDGYLNVKSGKLVIKNGKVQHVRVRGDLIKVSSGAYIKIRKGTYQGSLTNNGTMDIKNGTFTTALITNNGTLNISGGNFKSTVNLKIYNYSTLNITGGTFGDTCRVIG